MPGHWRLRSGKPLPVGGLFWKHPDLLGLIHEAQLEPYVFKPRLPLLGRRAAESPAAIPPGFFMGRNRRGPLSWLQTFMPPCFRFASDDPDPGELLQFEAVARIQKAVLRPGASKNMNFH